MNDCKCGHAQLAHNGEKYRCGVKNCQCKRYRSMKSALAYTERQQERRQALRDAMVV